MDPSINLCLFPPLKNYNINYYNTKKIKTNINLVNLDNTIEYGNKKYIEYLDKIKNYKFINIFENIDYSLLDKESIKLANIDAIFNVTNKIFTLDNKESNENFNFYEDEIYMEKYIYYRFPNAIKTNNNIDLIITNNIFEIKEFNKLKLGGNLVIKLNDISNIIYLYRIYYLSLCFEKISIIKPVTTLPYDNEKYLICINKINNNLNNINLFANNIKVNKLPNKFIEWYIEINDEIMELQINYIININKTINNPYDLNKFPIIWNIY